MIGSFFTKTRVAAVAGALAAVTIIGAAMPAEAQRRRGDGLNSMVGWTVLGVREVDDRRDRDRIRLRTRARFEQIKLCVVGGGIYMDDLDVVYGNGRRHDIRVRARLRGDRCTRAIDLRGRRARNIDEIVMRYEAGRRRGPQPTVIVVGR